MTLVRAYGDSKWKKISSEFYGITSTPRTSKQCRDRWFYVLVIQTRCKINLKERIEIINFFQIFGSQWSKISKIMRKEQDNKIIIN